MSKEVVIKKCMKCGATVRVLEDCSCEDCGIKCCGEQMQVLTPNSVDAAVEKHVPTYEVKDGKIFVKVNHVMDDDHFIEWISIVYKEKEVIRYFNPGENAETSFCTYEPGAVLYSYCNKHGLWKTEIK
ncbi:MAG: hypothetical protein IKG42_03915 [Clostridia bacterium]|nr:hypothetical protein [Clostridia bacterium]